MMIFWAAEAVVEPDDDGMPEMRNLDGWTLKKAYKR